MPSRVRSGPVLAAGDDRAHALRTDIAAILHEVDAGGVAVRAVMESADAQLGRDIVTALGDIGDSFSELRFLIHAVAQTGQDIRDALDEQGAGVRIVIDQNYRQATSIRLILDTVRAIETRTRSLAGGRAGGNGASAAMAWTSRCPYRGLLPFGEDDAEVFYGRELLTAELTVTTARQMASAGMVVVTGASGAGKSSLLRAGLLPALARGEAGAGSQAWPRFVITPGEEPLERLAAPLQALSPWPGDGGSLRSMLAGNPAGAAAVLRQALEVDSLSRRRELRRAARMVLIIDQFEQLFTLNPGPEGEAERQAFITALCAMGTGATMRGRVPPALVVIAVRGDFWARCAEYPMLAPHLQDGQFVVGPMTESELRLAITGPAEAAGLQIEESLADTIVADLRAARSRSGADGAGVLPLLSEAMRQTWERREENRLTSRGYVVAGGVSQAVRNRADAVYDALPPPQQVMAREMLLRMTTAGPDGEFARRPADRAELCAGFPAADVDTVLEALAGARLVILDQGIASISHDVLLHAWPRLRGWLERDRGALLLHGQLAEDAATWQSCGADSSYLYRGAQLAGVQDAAAIWSSEPGRYPPLTAQQRDFLGASERAQTRQARLRRTAVITLVVLLVLAVVSAGAVGLAARAEHTAALNASHQASEALSGELAVESEQLDTSDPVTAAQLAAASWQIAPTQQAWQSMLDVLAQPERAAVVATRDKLPVTAMGFARQGQVLITGGDDGLVREWDVTTRHELGSPLVIVRNPNIDNGPGNQVPAMAFSPQGDMLATVDISGKVRFWNLASRREIGSPIGIGGGGTAPAFSPDGKTLAVEGNSGNVFLLDVTSRKVTDFTLSGSKTGVNAVAFSPDGETLATADGSMLQLWSVATGRELAGPVQAVDLANYELETLAFSPDGKILATGGGDGKLRLWNVPSLQEIGAPVTASSGQLDSYVPVVTFSPNGKTLATGGGDGTVRLWSVATRRQVGSTFAANSGGAQHDYAVNIVAFRPDGATLATAGNDGIMRLWNLDIYQQIGSPVIDAGLNGIDMNAVAFSPDGKLLATSNQDAEVQLWNVASRRPVGRTIADPGGCNSLAFSPDGRILATNDADGKIRLWSVATQRQLSPPVGNVGNGNLRAMAFSPNGTILATGNQDGTVRLWNVADTRAHRPAPDRRERRRRRRRCRRVQP